MYLSVPKILTSRNRNLTYRNVSLGDLLAIKYLHTGVARSYPTPGLQLSIQQLQWTLQAHYRLTLLVIIKGA